ncbi:hypothetical protein V491_02372 [Pseudogymnoascus sp. VKM F-3775]|nr:hypothetical protein V491_02372 [Pseudogymnoascus sp. VKM F-3775]
MADDGQGRAKDERETDASNQTKHEHELPILAAHTQEHQIEHRGGTSQADEFTRPPCVKYWPYKYAEQKGQAGEDTKNPSHGGRAGISQLVSDEICLECPDAVHEGYGAE